MEIKFNVCFASWNSFNEKNCFLHDYFQQNTDMKSKTLSRICPVFSYLRIQDDVICYTGLSAIKKESNIANISFDFTLNNDLQNTEKILQTFKEAKSICTKCKNLQKNR